MNIETPRVYLADLAAYNAGRLSGVWIDATALSDPDTVTEAMQEAGMNPTAEEYAIHDYEHFGTYRVSEMSDWRFLAALADLADEHGPAVFSWVDHFGYTDPTDITDESFTDAYAGTWDSWPEYAGALADDCGTDRAIEELGDQIPLASYVRLDIAAFARDLEIEMTGVERAEPRQAGDYRYTVTVLDIFHAA